MKAAYKIRITAFKRASIFRVVVSIPNSVVGFLSYASYLDQPMAFGSFTKSSNIILLRDTRATPPLLMRPCYTKEMVYLESKHQDLSTCITYKVELAHQYQDIE